MKKAKPPRHHFPATSSRRSRATRRRNAAGAFILLPLPAARNADVPVGSTEAEASFSGTAPALGCRRVRPVHDLERCKRTYRRFSPIAPRGRGRAPRDPSNRSHPKIHYLGDFGMSLEGLRRLGRLSAALSRGVHEPAAIKAATIVPKRSFLGLIFFNIFGDAIAKLCLVLCVLITFTP